MSFLSVLIVFQLLQNKADAFNPVAFVTGMQAVSGIMQSKSEVEEIAGIGSALVDLLEDLEIDQSSEDEVNEAVEKLQELDTKLKKSKSIHSEMTSVMSMEIKRANSLKDQIRTLKSMIGKAKRIADLMRATPKAGAAVADVQNIQINTMILSELQSSRRSRDLVQVENTKARAERILFMDELRREYEEKAR